MDAQQLRALQQPLKESYREDPGQALITLRASGVAGEGITCSVATGRAMVEAGLHPATGGDGTHLCSGDLLLEALVACAGVTLKAVATSIGVPLASATITAEGDLDFRGTLGVSRDTPVGFRDVRLHFELRTTADEPSVDKLLELTERYCVVLQTIRASTPTSSSWSS